MKQFFFGLLVMVGPWLAAAPATVQIKEASLYDKPSPTAKFLGKIPYGTVLTVSQEKDGWAQVRVEPKGKSGWIRVQSYTTKPLAMKASSSASTDVSATEVSLAGRGFTEEIEADYKKKNPALNFAVLDDLETQEIPEEELKAFLSQGGVTPAEARR